jgi:hypothetical protein
MRSPLVASGAGAARVTAWIWTDPLSSHARRDPLAPSCASEEPVKACLDVPEFVGHPSVPAGLKEASLKDGRHFCGDRLTFTDLRFRYDIFLPRLPRESSHWRRQGEVWLPAFASLSSARVICTSQCTRHRRYSNQSNVRSYCVSSGRYS